MDNQDQRRTHTQGHEHHEVHVCHKCGWPFPNPHPSAKHRRAHKKICGTIEGYQVLATEGQTHFNPSDDEQLSDDDHKRQGPKALDTSNNEKGSGGIGEKSIRSGDEVFLDAVGDFSDGGPSPGVNEPLRDSLDSATGQEIIERKYPEFSGPSQDYGSNEESQSIFESRNDVQMQNPKIYQSEKVEDGNMLELQGQLSSATVNPLESSIADLKTEELTVVLTNDCSGLTSDAKPSKSEAMSDVLLENKIYADENMRVCSSTSVAKKTTLKEKDDIKSDRDMVEIVVSSDNTRDETVEGVSKIAVSGVDNLNYQESDGTYNLKEKNNAEFPSVMSQDDLPLEVDSAESINASIIGIQVESAHMIELAASSDVKTLQEREEGNVHVLIRPSCDDRPNVAHPQSEYEDHERVVSQNSSIPHSSKALEQERNVLNDSVTEENDNQPQLSENQDMHDLNSNMNKEQVNCELMAEEMHGEESIEVSPVTFKDESDKRLDDTGASMNAMKTEMNESHMVQFSEGLGYDDICKNSQQVNLPKGSFMAASNENPSDASFGSAASETTTVISKDNLSHRERNILDINDIAVDDNCMKALQPSNLHLEINPSSLYKTEDAVEMGKFECDIKDTQYTKRPFVKDTPLPATSHFESAIVSDVVMDGSARTPEGCTNRGPLSGAEEDIKVDKIISNDRLNEDCDRIATTNAYSHQAQDEELLLKPTEGFGKDHSPLSSLNIEPSAQHVSAVEDTQDDKPGREVPGVIVPVQDQGGHDDVKLAPSANTSVGPGSRCDGLEANWGSVSVLSAQSDAQPAIEAEALSSTDLPASTEAGKSNLNDPETASERQQCEKTEMFEPPSFMTLVEPGHMVGTKPAASEDQTESNKQHPNFTSSQAGWFPTLTHVTNESQGRKRNEQIIAKVTNRSTSKQQNAPLRNLLGEAAHSSKPKSPELEKHSVNQKNVKVAEDTGSGLTTVNSLLGHESPAAQVVKGERAKEWNSTSDIKREKKKKAKSRPHWIQLLCCSSVDTR